MSSTAIIYAILAGLLPSFIWLWFWLREDTHSEPRSLIATTFVGGMLAVIVAIFAEKYISEIVTDQTLQYTLWAGVEEIVKFIAVTIIFLNSDYNDEPIKAMIYCIVVALGFSAVENALFLLKPLSDGAISQSLVMGNMRFIGATLVHIVSSASIGFALGLVFYQSKVVKVFAILIGICTAIALHASFNLSIIGSNGSIDTLKAFGWVWGAVVILIVLFEEIKGVRPKLT